jgi:hypothetical protein
MTRIRTLGHYDPSVERADALRRAGALVRVAPPKT